MSRIHRSASRRGRRRRRSEEDINPMNYIANLSDVMLILAVGIMLSLVLHWKVDLESVKEQDTVQEDTEDVITTTFTDDDLEDSTEVPDTVERLGDVYYDPETGTYYILDERSN